MKILYFRVLAGSQRGCKCNATLAAPYTHTNRDTSGHVRHNHTRTHPHTHIHGGCMLVFTGRAPEIPYGGERKFQKLHHQSEPSRQQPPLMEGNIKAHLEWYTSKCRDTFNENLIQSLRTSCWAESSPSNKTMTPGTWPRHHRSPKNSCSDTSDPAAGVSAENGNGRISPHPGVHSWEHHPGSPDVPASADWA